MPQKRVQGRGYAGFCGVRIGLRPMMKYPFLTINPPG